MGKDKDTQQEGPMVWLRDGTASLCYGLRGERSNCVVMPEAKLISFIEDIGESLKHGMLTGSAFIVNLDRGEAVEPKPARRKDLMTIPEVGERLGLSRSTAYEAARRGMFPVVRNGKRMYVPVAAFENWLAGAGLHPTWPQKEEAPR